MRFIETRKLDGTMKYVHTLTVRGRGRFPVDMLRHDHAWPRTGADSAEIEKSFEARHRDQWEVTVVSYSESKLPPFTLDRWRSFMVQPVELEATWS